MMQSIVYLLLYLINHHIHWTSFLLETVYVQMSNKCAVCMEAINQGCLSLNSSIPINTITIQSQVDFEKICVPTSALALDGYNEGKHYLHVSPCCLWDFHSLLRRQLVSLITRTHKLPVDHRFGGCHWVKQLYKDNPWHSSGERY